VVDTNNDGSLFDEVPCNCLGNNPDWIVGFEDDPNGDNWGDCGWDGYCPGHPNDTNGDENGTEKNGIWDTFERFEENGRYDFDILTSTREYFIDEGNEVSNEPVEFCVKGDDGECDSSDPFEDRNCNGKWDDAESGDEGNGIWDDDESFIVDADGDTLLYALSDGLITFIVDYSDPENPVQITEVDINTTITSYYGNIQDSEYIPYSNFLENVQIQAYYAQQFHDIDRKETIYTNKIIEYSGNFELCDCDGNVDVGCGCGEAGPSGCDNACGSTLENDTCGVCGGDGSDDQGCGCFEAGPSGCDDTCGSTLENDACGVCGGDNSICTGCSYESACNYNYNAIIDDGSCFFAEQYYDCDGNCLIPEDTDENADCDGQLSIDENIIPTHYGISSIHPNPFNPVTNITYGLPEHVNVQIIVYDLSGKQVETLINEFQSPGYHSVNWDADNLPSGVYLIRMDSGDFTQTQKVVLVE